MKQIALLLLFVLLVFPLAMTACKAPVAEIPSPIPPVYLEDIPLCDLPSPDDESPWHHFWRARSETGGVRDLMRDGDWLWVVTPVDIVRLDLRTLDCTRFDHTVGDSEMSLSGIRSLLPDPDGRLWAVGSTGLARFDGQRWQTIVDQFYAGTIAFDADGNLWAETSGGARSGLVWVRYPGHEPPKNGSWERERVRSTPEITCDRWTVWSGQFRSSEECRLLEFWRGRLALESPPEGIASWTGYEPIAAESDERLWVLARGQSDNPRSPDILLNFDGQRWQAVSFPYGVSRWFRSDAYLVADDARGGVWVGTDEGLTFSDGRSVQKYLIMPGDATPTGLPVRDLAVDSRGRLWAVTDRELLLYDETLDAWQTIRATERELLISADEQGGLWVVSRDLSGRISYYDGETWTHYLPPDRWPCYPESILADVGGGLWLSSRDCALRGFNGEVWDEYDNGSRGDLLVRGPDGAVYIVGRSDFGAIRRYDGDTWETLLPNDPSRRRWIVDLAVGPRGEIWAALDIPPKLIVCHDGEWEVALEAVDETITALLVDSQGDLWAGYSEGLLHYDGETWEYIEGGFPFDAHTRVNALVQDRQGRIWVGGENGLSVYDPAGTQ
jgi:streptogramin lyase